MSGTDRLSPLFQSQDNSWMQCIFLSLFHFLQNKWLRLQLAGTYLVTFFGARSPGKCLFSAFRLLSATAYVSGRADWFRCNDTQWTLEQNNFIGLETRLAYVKVTLAIDSSDSFDQQLIGSCLILSEKLMLLLSNEYVNNDSKLIQLIQPDR